MTLEFRIEPTATAAAAEERARRPVVTVAVCALVVELVLAATTYGTNDITSWRDFARAVSLVGPVQVYGYQFTNDLYNHPPLVGFFLVAVNGLSRLGLQLNFTLRAISSICETASALLLFDLLRTRHSLQSARRAGVLVAASPVLVMVSGFHGNTDPIFIMFMIAALWLLADKDRPCLAGAMLAAGMSTKIVAAVILPILVVWAWKQGRRRFVCFTSGCLGLLLLIWTPAIVTEWSPLLHNVVGYGGVSARPWGLPQFAAWAGLPRAAAWLAGGGRALIVLACSLLPAFAVHRKPEVVAEAVALSVAGFLLLSPAFGVQYLLWPVALAYALDFRAATIYNILASVLAVGLYMQWSGGVVLNNAESAPLTEGERLFASLVWAALFVVVARGVSIVTSGREERGAAVFDNVLSGRGVSSG